MKSLKNKILASALALTLVGGAFAGTKSNAAEETPKQLYIKKVLTIPEGVKAPKEDFGFEFSFDSNESKVTLSESEVAPDLSGTISYTDADTVTDTDNDKSNGQQFAKLTTEDILANKTFPKPGQYVYNIKETNGKGKDITYSKVEYKISIFVSTVNGKNIPTKIFIVKTKDEAGKDVTDQKIEYVPEEANNNFTFENSYDPTSGNTNPDGGKTDIQDEDKKGFVLRKEVAGDNANESQEFQFKISIDKPAGSKSGETEATYNIISNGNVTTGSIKYGETGTVTLKHNDRIVFSNILLGSTVKVEEADAGYTQSIGNNNVMNGQPVDVDGLKSGHIIGDIGDNAIDFVNTQQTPTGILLNNLPFIALVGLAGIGIFFFVKNKKEEETLA